MWMEWGMERRKKTYWNILFRHNVLNFVIDMDSLIENL